MPRFSGVFVTGTDTDVGKTVVSAALVQTLQATYWKPIQSGLDEVPGGDAAVVAALTGRRVEDFPPPLFSLRRPLSPDQAAEDEGICIDVAALRLPSAVGPLVVEGAGGPLVPISRSARMIDLALSFRLPVVVTARTELGTINHTVLCLEALARRNIPVAGVIFSGEDRPRNIEAIRHWGGVPILGRIPRLAPLNRKTLSEAASGLDCSALAQLLS